MTELVITIGIIIGVIVVAMVLDTAIDAYYDRKIERTFFKQEMDRYIVSSILVDRSKKHDSLN